MDTLVLRPATRADIPLLRAWDEEPHVVASDPNDDWDWDDVIGADLPGYWHLIAEASGRPIGFVQILDPGLDPTRYWGEVGSQVRAIDIWIGPQDALGQGYGTQMMRQALALCFAEPTVEAVLIDPIASNTDAIRFYQRIGFTFLEHRWFGADHCAVHQFRRQDFSRE
jgi:aminoglycoside 6'-N-acetyltransferase